jgi:hypothetical protein
VAKRARAGGGDRRHRRRRAAAALAGAAGVAVIGRSSPARPTSRWKRGRAACAMIEDGRKRG